MFGCLEGTDDPPGGDPILGIYLFGSDDRPFRIVFEETDETVDDRFGPFDIRIDDEQVFGSEDRGGDVSTETDLRAVSTQACSARRLIP